MYQYEAPITPEGKEGVACCAGLSACVERRPKGYPGFGKVSDVVVCRATCCSSWKSKLQPTPTVTPGATPFEEDY